jgi:hypothetical protein
VNTGKRTWLGSAHTSGWCQMETHLPTPPKPGWRAGHLIGARPRFLRAHQGTVVAPRIVMLAPLALHKEMARRVSSICLRLSLPPSWVL